MKRNYKRLVILLGIIIFLMISILNSKLLIYNVLDYTKLFITKLFPVTFVFFIVSSLLIDYGFIETISKIFHINGAVFYVIVMSMMSGFPSGSKYIKELLDKNIISLKTANYLITFTHFPNPLFVLGSVNLVIKDDLLSVYMLIAIIISNLIIGIITKTKEKSYFNIDNSSLKSFSYYLSKAVNSSLRVIILIYGTSLFFNLIATFIIKYININLGFNILFNGIFDLTKGVFSTSIIPNKIIKSLIIICFISFGGISIHMQVMSIIEGSSIKYNNFLIGRIFQGIIACCIFLFLIKFFYL